MRGRAQPPIVNYRERHSIVACVTIDVVCEQSEASASISERPLVKCNATIRIDTWTSVEGDVLSHSDRLAWIWHANKKVGNRRLICPVHNVHYDTRESFEVRTIRDC